MSPEKSIELRRSSGSPSLIEQKNNFGIVVERKKRYEQQTLEREKHLASALTNLLNMIESCKKKGTHCNE
jgi:hypothetical protein